MAGKKYKGKKRVVNMEETRALLESASDHDRVEQESDSSHRDHPEPLRLSSNNATGTEIPTESSHVSDPRTSPHTLESFDVFASSSTAQNGKRNYLSIQKSDPEHGELESPNASRPPSPKRSRGSISFGRHEDHDLEQIAKRKETAFRGIAAIFVILSLLVGLGIFIAVERAFSPGNSSPVPVSDKVVLLISLDGFRPEYLSRSVTPTLAGFARSGVSAKSMIPSFPSITFPNHYTLVTGLYPESHGIVGNAFYDPTRNDTFSYTSYSCNVDAYWWARAEPIWITAVKQGFRSATCMWPGSEASHDGLKATYSLPYSNNITADQEIDQIVDWLSLPVAKRPHLIAVYLHDVDSQGHASGVDSVNESLQTIDHALSKLNQSISDLGLKDVVDIVIVSDHGMTDVSSDRLILLDDLIDLNRVRFLYNGVIVGMYPKNMADEDDIFKALRKAAVKDGRFQVWRKEDVPDHFHYSDSDRIPPIILLPHLGWLFDDKSRTYPLTLRGAHGYLNTDPDMHAIFIAAGSSFQKRASSILPPFPNVQVYGIVAHLLKLKPLSHNGSSIWTNQFVRTFLK